MASGKGRKEAPDDVPSGIMPILGVILLAIIIYAIISAF